MPNIESLAYIEIIPKKAAAFKTFITPFKHRYINREIEPTPSKKVAQKPTKIA